MNQGDFFRVQAKCHYLKIVSINLSQNMSLTYVMGYLKNKNKHIALEFNL